MKHVSFLKFYYVLGNLVNFAGKGVTLGVFRTKLFKNIAGPLQNK